MDSLPPTLILVQGRTLLQTLKESLFYMSLFNHFTYWVYDLSSLVDWPILIIEITFYFHLYMW